MKVVEFFYQNTKYFFDPEEPGYTKSEAVAQILKHKYPKHCGICNDTVVYFWDFELSTDTSHYVCSDCYEKRK